MKLLLLPIICALMTALCWGAYGPTLALARSALQSPFKPFVAIGFAYLVWGIGGGLVGMKFKGDSFTFSGPGVLWGFNAGTLGAVGALFLTVAMLSGGAKSPHVITAYVFGGAVTVAGIISWWQTRGQVESSPLLWASIVGMIICSVSVAYNTPHLSPKGAPHATAPHK